MKIKCLGCGSEISVALKDVLDPKQKLTMEITLKGEMIKASVLGGMLVNNGKLLEAVAKDVGFKASVYVSGLSMSGNKVSIDFTTLTAPNKLDLDALKLEEKAP